MSSSSKEDRLSKYTIRRQIGKGSCGTVYLVEYGAGRKNVSD